MSCFTSASFLVGLSDTYLHAQMQYVFPICKLNTRRILLMGFGRIFAGRGQKRFFPELARGFLGVAKMVKIHFIHLKPKKQPYLLKIDASAQAKIFIGKRLKVPHSASCQICFHVLKQVVLILKFHRVRLRQLSADAA